MCFGWLKTTGAFGQSQGCADEKVTAAASGNDGSHQSADDHFVSPGMTKKYLNPATTGMNQCRDRKHNERET